MGFGPKAGSVETGVQAVRDLMELLYPDAVSPQVLDLFGETARALLTAKAALSFENLDRFWQDATWRAWIASRWPSPLTGPWDAYPDQSVNPADLNPQFGALIADRIRASQAFLDQADDS